MLDLARIRAITLDLDDTLWPVGPTIARAEQALQAWLDANAPATAAHWGQEERRRAVRAQVNRDFAHQAHDLTVLRRESIRLALCQAGDDPALAAPAFEAFFAERQRVAFFPDAQPALTWLGSRYPLVALTNGNADLERVGIAAHFTAAVSAREAGVAKPDPRIFHAAAQRAGVEPAAVLHVGDDAALDVLAALGVGMQTAWVCRDGQAWAQAGVQPHLAVGDLLALCHQLGMP